MQERWRHARIELETKTLREQFMASFPEQCFAHATTNPLGSQVGADFCEKRELLRNDKLASPLRPCGAEAGQHDMRQHEMSVSSFFSGLEERENQFGAF